jgi:hypothetical protein
LSLHCIWKNNEGQNDNQGKNNKVAADEIMINFLWAPP